MGYNVISPFRVTKLTELSTEPWIRGCAHWMWHWGLQGWTPYYINFMFKPLAGSGDAVSQQMRQAIEEGFYPRFCTMFVRHPGKPSQKERLPKFWLFRDRPCFKQGNKTSVREMQFNDNGCHYNGPMMIPPVSRFHECPIQHIHSNRKKYAVRGIDRIHVKLGTWDLDGLADYAGKTLKWDRDASEHVILLPDDKVKKPVPAMSAEDRVIKDIQARHNVSKEVARDMMGLERV